jgi:two-component system alkaline phosphatase synthesis response regulator PhoP
MEISLEKKIVFADDEIFMRELWKQILTEEGYDEECLEIAEKEKPDLIISDILMPQMDGLDLCEEIRKRESLCDIPIILITGVFKDLTFRSRVDSSTADAFILKPLDEKLVLSKIQELIRKKR